MSDIRARDLVARYTAKVSDKPLKGASGIACAIFAAALGAAFWAGAVLASTPLPH